MSNVRFSFLVLLALTLTVTSCSTTSIETEDAIYTTTSTSANLTTTLEQEVIDLVNDYRVSQGLNKVVINNAAYDFAKDHNTYMIGQGTISHDNFNVRASNLAQKVNAQFVSENLAKDFTTARSVVDAWINSPTHKEVMEGDFTHTAISIDADQDGILYYTQVFFK